MKRVVVTGTGAICSLGQDWSGVRAALRSGRSGVSANAAFGEVRYQLTDEKSQPIEGFTFDDRADDNGFRTILTGPPHPPFARFTPGWGHGLGFNDLKVIEAAHLLQAIAEETPAWPDFAEGWRVEAVVEAIARSAATRRWEPVPV